MRPRNLTGKNLWEWMLANCVTAEPNTGCFLWTGRALPNGYGVTRHLGKWETTHRISYKFHFGNPEGGVVRHTCDQKLCLNPSHLLSGSHQDNMDDKVSRGRTFKPKGMKHPMAKLNRMQVYEIRSDPRSYPKIAKTYGVSIPTICNIKTRKTWAHLPEDSA